MNTCKCITRKTKEVCNNPAEYITVVWKGSNIYLPGFQSTAGWLEAEALVCRMHINNSLQKGRSLEYMTNLLVEDLKDVFPSLPNCKCQLVDGEMVFCATHKPEENNICPKCNGEGVLTWTSVDKGRCWQCGGTGKCDKPENTAVLVVGPDLNEAKKEWDKNWRGKGSIKKNHSTGNWEIHRNN